MKKQNDTVYKQQVALVNDNRNHAARMVESNKEVIDQLKANAVAIAELRHDVKRDVKDQLAQQKRAFASELSKMCIKLRVDQNTPRSDTNPSDATFVTPKGTLAPTSFKMLATGGVRKCPKLFPQVIPFPTVPDDAGMEEEADDKRVEERRLSPNGNKGEVEAPPLKRMFSTESQQQEPENTTSKQIDAILGGDFAGKSDVDDDSLSIVGDLNPTGNVINLTGSLLRKSSTEPLVEEHPEVKKLFGEIVTDHSVPPPPWSHAKEERTSQPPGKDSAGGKLSEDQKSTEHDDDDGFQALNDDDDGASGEQTNGGDGGLNGSPGKGSSGGDSGEKKRKKTTKEQPDEGGEDREQGDETKEGEEQGQESATSSPGTPKELVIVSQDEGSGGKKVIWRDRRKEFASKFKLPEPDLDFLHMHNAYILFVTHRNMTGVRKEIEEDPGITGNNSMDEDSNRSSIDSNSSDNDGEYFPSPSCDESDETPESEVISDSEEISARKKEKALPKKTFDALSESTEGTGAGRFFAETQNKPTPRPPAMIHRRRKSLSRSSDEPEDQESVDQDCLKLTEKANRADEKLKHLEEEKRAEEEAQKKRDEDEADERKRVKKKKKLESTPKRDALTLCLKQKLDHILNVHKTVEQDGFEKSKIEEVHDQGNTGRKRPGSAAHSGEPSGKRRNAESSTTVPVASQDAGEEAEEAEVGPMAKKDLPGARKVKGKQMGPESKGRGATGGRVSNAGRKPPAIKTQRRVKKPAVNFNGIRFTYPHPFFSTNTIPSWDTQHPPNEETRSHMINSLTARGNVFSHNLGGNYMESALSHDFTANMALNEVSPASTVCYPLEHYVIRVEEDEKDVDQEEFKKEQAGLAKSNPEFNEDLLKQYQTYTRPCMPIWKDKSNWVCLGEFMDTPDGKQPVCILHYS